MLRKYKIILLSFDEILANALCDWLNSIGDIEAKIESENSLAAQLAAWPNAVIIISCKENATALLNYNLPQDMPIIAIGNKAPSLESSNQTHINLPLRFANLEASLRQVLRWQDNGQMAALAIADHVFNPAKRAFIGPNGKDLKLTDKEISILTYLNGADGASISREELLREVWRYNQGVTTHTLETHIYRLRQKLSGFFGEREILITTEGGYRLQS